MPPLFDWHPDELKDVNEEVVSILLEEDDTIQAVFVVLCDEKSRSRKHKLREGFICS